ncbi:MAG: hypothetical protein ACPGVU_02515 [Limisphaerales bacterium]
MSDDVDIRRRRRVIWTCVTIAALPLIFCGYQRLHGINMLKAKLYDLKQAGEEIDYRAFAQPIPNSESNAAVALRNLFPRIETIDGLLRSRPPANELATNFHRRPFLELKEWEASVWLGDEKVQRTNDWATFILELGYHTNLLNETISALERPQFHTGYNPDNGFLNLRMDFLRGSQQLERLLASGFSFHLQNGGRDQAHQCLLALLKLSQGMQNDRLIISELVSQAIFSAGRMLIWQALQVDGWTDKQLREWSEQVAKSNFADGMINARRME